MMMVKMIKPDDGEQDGAGGGGNNKNVLTHSENKERVRPSLIAQPGKTSRAYSVGALLSLTLPLSYFGNTVDVLNNLKSDLLILLCSTSSSSTSSSLFDVLGCRSQRSC